MGRRPKNYVPPTSPILMGCVRCGKSKEQTEFYSNKQSKIYNIKKRVPLCKDCVQALLEEYSYRYGEEIAVFALCGVMDIPFLSERYRKIIETDPPFTFGKYVKQIQINQYRDKSFVISVADRVFPETEQASPITYAPREHFNRLQEDVSILREELQNIRANLAESGNAHK